MNEDDFYSVMGEAFANILALVDTTGTHFAYDPVLAKQIVDAGGLMEWSVSKASSTMPIRGADGQFTFRKDENKANDNLADGIFDDVACTGIDAIQCLCAVAGREIDIGGGTAMTGAAALHASDVTWDYWRDRIVDLWISEMSWEADNLESAWAYIKANASGSDLTPITDTLGTFPESLSKTLHDSLGVYDEPAGTAVDVAAFLSQCSVMIGGEEVNLLSGLMVEFGFERYPLSDALVGIVYESGDQAALKAIKELLAVSYQHEVQT